VNLSLRIIDNRDRPDRDRRGPLFVINSRIVGKPETVPMTLRLFAITLIDCSRSLDRGQ